MAVRAEPAAALHPQDVAVAVGAHVERQVADEGGVAERHPGRVRLGGADVGAFHAEALDYRGVGDRDLGDLELGGAVVHRTDPPGPRLVPGGSSNCYRPTA